MTIQQLNELAACYRCIPTGMQQAVIISLLDQIAAGGGGGGGQNQTPWLSDIDGAGFDLFNVGVVSAGEFVAGAAGLNFGSSVLLLDAADTLALRDGTNSQTFRIYGTFTSAANNNRIAITKNSITVEKVGAAPDLDLTISNNTTLGLVAFGTNSVSRWQINPNGFLYASLDNVYDIGDPAGLRPRAIYSAGTIKGTLTTLTNATTGLGAGVVAAMTNATLVITDGAGVVYRIPAII